ncbi:hypothetical protein EXN66_Car015558 [Channa argus]|uniref:Uncharacterized protein n=1 Tax=Channa argus TaxID=215402 RepID=A0A6G1QB58_CHAAH|nr:hypothetical protein EXN66_Car015558 [Channa argus]
MNYSFFEASLVNLLSGSEFLPSPLYFCFYLPFSCTLFGFFSCLPSWFLPAAFRYFYPPPSQSPAIQSSGPSWAPLQFRYHSAHKFPTAPQPPLPPSPVPSCHPGHPHSLSL